MIGNVGSPMTTEPAGPGELSLFDALLAPWVIAGVPAGVLRGAVEELRKRLGPLSDHGGEPDLSSDRALRAVESLRDAAGLDRRDSLEVPGALPDALPNAAGHGLCLARAWCEAHQVGALPDGFVERYRNTFSAASLDLKSAAGWAEVLESIRAVSIQVDVRYGPRVLRLVPGSVDDLGADA